MCSFFSWYRFHESPQPHYFFKAISKELLHYHYTHIKVEFSKIKKFYPYHIPHDFRHTYVTNLLTREVDLKTIASLLEDTIATVEKMYIHYSEEIRKNSVIKLNAIWG